MKARYRKLPVVVEAVQWTGMEADLPAVFDLIPKKENGGFDLPNDGQYVMPGIGFVPPTGELTIPTLEGDMTASPGDWIIRGVQGEIYPCKPEIFAQTYERWDDFEPPRGLTVADLAGAMEAIKDAPPSPPAPHHPKCDLVHGRGFCNCPTAEFERQVRGG